MSRICPLFSSSKGNSTYLSGGGTSLLIDAGVSLRQLAKALGEHGLSPDQLSGILITHEHSDHIKGLSMLLKKFDIPVFASLGTLNYLCSGGYIPAHAKAYELAGSACIGNIEVTPFDTPHDANHSLGFRFIMPDARTVAFATDLGHITDIVRQHITGCDLVMLESNYDKGMLDCSAYPYYLKRRIKGDYGHLSNEVCSSECERLIQTGTTRLILAHLSENNNMPGLAHQSAKNTLETARMKENLDYMLWVAPARGTSEMVVF